jgi:hypothetical protein
MAARSRYPLPLQKQIYFNMEYISAPQNTKTVVYPRGYTNDIIRVVLDVYTSDFLQCQKIADKLTGETVKQTAKNIFDFVVSKVKYLEDPNGKQWVKTPARLIADGVGDCKSFSVFIASCLKCKKIKHAFRFAAYGGSSKVSHVYIIVWDENNNTIIVDPVAYIQQNTPFGAEIAYTKNIDIMSYTEISKLAGIGEIVNYWSGGKGAGSLKVSEIEIYSKIDLLQSKASIETDAAKISALFSEMDVWFTAIKLIEKFGASVNDLRIAGQILGTDVLLGSFSRNYPTLEVRQIEIDKFIESLILRIKNVIVSGMNISPFVTDQLKPFVKEWETLVIGQNYYLLMSGATETNPTASVGATIYEYSAQIKDAAPYFIYAATNEKLSKKAAIKKVKHMENIDWILSNNTGLNRAAIMNNIESGIITKLGKSPDQAIKDLKNGVAVGATDWDQFVEEQTVDLDTSTAKKSFDWNSVLTSVGKITESISTIATVFKKTDAPSANSLSTYSPSYSDWTGNLKNILVFGALAFGGYTIYKKAKAKKDEKKGKK